VKDAKEDDFLKEPHKEKGGYTMSEREIGVIVHYWGKIGVAGITITDGELKIGDTIHIKGATSDFTVTVDSMQTEKHAIEVAKKGDDIGVKVPDAVREHDKVYLVTDES
jgi:putative protease